jgi:hypothetical protein
MRIGTVFAFAGAIGLCGAAQAKPWDRDRPAHEGHPPAGIMKADISLRVSHDGRAETGDVRGASVSDPSLRFQHQRPDSNVGQERHFALPVKSSILLHVSLGDGGEAARAAGLHGQQAEQQRTVRTYAEAASHRSLHLPIKNEILMKVMEGGQPNLGDNNNGRSLDDPKLDRNAQNHANTSMRNGPAPRNTRVYPGRHENIPTVPEMFMIRGKTQSQGNDSPGDKDAA